MKIPPGTPPEGLLAVKARVAAIKTRFGGFGSALSSALSRSRELEPGGLRQAIAAAADKHGLDPDLLLAVAEVESGLRPEAVSPRGARGLMQLMPSTAAALGVGDGFDVEENIEGGARYLREQIDRFGGDLALALAAYNAGPGAVAGHGGIPPYSETQSFVSRVLSRLAAAQAGR